MTPLSASSQHECTGTCRSCPSVGSCPDRIVCRCFRVTEQAVIAAILTLGVRTVKELRQATEAGGGCTCCHKELRQYLDVYVRREAMAEAS
jgi:bacterioferritin-associated ferredoxin